MQVRKRRERYAAASDGGSHVGGKQRGKLLAVVVPARSARKRVGSRRMAIDLTDAIRQAIDERGKSFTTQRAGPGHSEHVVRGHDASVRQSPGES